MRNSSLLDVATPRQARTRQVTSLDRDPDRGGTWMGLRPAPARRKRVLLSPGETHPIAVLEGAGIITRLWMTVLPGRSSVLREVVLRMYWDGEPTPSVECPLGDFFGALLGHRVSYVSEPLSLTNGAFNSTWPMPFAVSARLEITNEGSAPVDPLFYQVTYYELRAVDHSLRFHAQWRRENPTQPGVSYEVLDARGNGHYVGCHLFVQNHEWWLRPRLTHAVFPFGFGLGMLEGWGSIRVDGEERPSIAGTGTEDDFNGAWYNLLDGRISAPHHGCTIRNLLRARVAMYRFDIPAPVPFDRSIAVSIDHGFQNQLACDYASVAYWYQSEPHAAFPALAPPDRRRPSSTRLNLLQAALVIGLIALGAGAVVWVLATLAG